MSTTISESNIDAVESAAWQAGGRMDLIVNPISGGGKGRETLYRLLHIWQRNGWEVVPFMTRKGGDARRYAESIHHECRLIGVCGGDGTLNEVINGLERFDIPIAFLPAGTGNVMAKELRLPWSPPKASMRYRHAKVVTADLGICNGRRFISVVGAGVDGEVVREVHAGRTGHLTQWDYLPYMLYRVMFAEHEEVEATVDGVPLEGKFHNVIVGNSRHYGGPIAITTLASIADGLLDVCAFRMDDVTQFVRHGLAALWRTLPGRPGVVYRRAKTVQIRSDTNVAYEVDGDPAGRLPLKIEVLPKTVKLLWPEFTPLPSRNGQDLPS